MSSIVRRPPGPVRGEVGRIDSGQPTPTSHFHSNGVELRLPQERRDLGRDVPGNKPPPTAK